MSRITCRDVMQLSASVSQVRRFIMDPQRIADYYPGVLDFGTFAPGKAIWCSARSGVTLLALNQSESTASKRVLTVTSSRSVRKPYTIEGITADPFLSMVEDWEIAAQDGGTRLTKTWRDVQKYKMKWLPMNLIIRRTAGAEHQKLIDGWNRAALAER